MNTGLKTQDQRDNNELLADCIMQHVQQTHFNAVYILFLFAFCNLSG